MFGMSGDFKDREQHVFELWLCDEGKKNMKVRFADDWAFLKQRSNTNYYGWTSYSSRKSTRVLRCSFLWKRGESATAEPRRMKTPRETSIPNLWCEISFALGDLRRQWESLKVGLSFFFCNYFIEVGRWRPLLLTDDGDGRFGPESLQERDVVCAQLGCCSLRVFALTATATLSNCRLKERGLLICECYVHSIMQRGLDRSS